MNRALAGIRVVDLTVEFWGSIGACCWRISGRR